MMDIIRLLVGVALMVGLTMMMSHRPEPQEPVLLMSK